MAHYPVPARQTRTEILVVNSRFIATAAPARTVEKARSFIARVRNEFPDATHHVPAFLVGHGSSVIAHCSDDGEPSGTAGRPVLAALRGSGLGDVAAVITRYFGGTKLGTGGLVRAYSEAARTVLETLPRAMVVPSHTVIVKTPYSHLDRVQLAVGDHHGQVLDREFAADVTLHARLAVDRFASFQDALRDLSSGSLEAVIIATDEETIVPLDQNMEPA